MAMSGANGYAPSLQTITGSYTLQPKLQAVVNGFVNLSNTAVANITAAEDLATYQNIHPLYLEVRRTLAIYMIAGLAEMLESGWVGSEYGVENSRPHKKSSCLVELQQC